MVHSSFFRVRALRAAHTYWKCIHGTYDVNMFVLSLKLSKLKFSGWNIKSIVFLQPYILLYFKTVLRWTPIDFFIFMITRYVLLNKSYIDLGILLIPHISEFLFYILWIHEYFIDRIYTCELYCTIKLGRKNNDYRWNNKSR